MNNNLLQDLPTPVNAQDVASNLYLDSVAYPNPISVAADPSPALVDQIYLVDNSSSSLTFTLPDSPAAGSKIQVVDKAGISGTNNITVQPSGSDVIYGSSVLNVDHASISYIYTSGGWYQITKAPGILANPGAQSFVGLSSGLTPSIGSWPSSSTRLDVVMFGTAVSNGVAFRAESGVTYLIEFSLQGVSASQATINIYLRGTSSGNIVLFPQSRGRSSGRGTGLCSFAYIYTSPITQTLYLYRTSTSYSYTFWNVEAITATILSPNSNPSLAGSVDLCQASNQVANQAAGSSGSIVSLPTLDEAQGNLSLASNQIQGLLANNTYRIVVIISSLNFSNSDVRQLVVTGSVTGALSNDLYVGNLTRGMTKTTLYHIPSSNESVYLTYLGNLSWNHNLVSLEVVRLR
jgi:hypothetical protein